MIQMEQFKLEDGSGNMTDEALLMEWIQEERRVMGWMMDVYNVRIKGSIQWQIDHTCVMMKHRSMKKKFGGSLNIRECDAA